MILVFDPEQDKTRTWTHGEIDGLCFIATIRSLATRQADRAAILGCAYELRHYMLTATNVSIRHVHMLCPPSISGRAFWTLEELESVVAFSGMDTNDNAVVYKTAVASYKLGDLDRSAPSKERPDSLFNTATIGSYPFVCGPLGDCPRQPPARGAVETMIDFSTQAGLRF
ncbi:hypothetical protein IFT47_26080 [Pseudomonas sp. CFBP 13711]|uniref:hypothetical protein n=1 Tax=unclassified Pseudomonas TaxID=196821 RepID=UPI00177B04BE|nr:MULTISPECIES: hypothetical protein [unclassified Pseudomonas]MBD8710108.1 hypothetical protein [Pseudomonas sp. CFBP 13711]MBD8715396.1 hypothetical protein [Pseudomonas sp. CFBP 13715]